MELLLTVTAGPDRRLTGTARRRDRDAVVAFSGSLELLACLERLCLNDLCLNDQGLNDLGQDEAAAAPTLSPVTEDR